MPADPTIVALLGPRADATCTEPGCGYPDPCEECEERRHIAVADHGDPDPCASPGCRYAADAAPLAEPCSECASAGGWF